MPILKTDTAEFGPLALSPKKTAIALDCGLTRVYGLMNSGELDSYLDGGSRKITTESIRRYQAARLAEARNGSAPVMQHDKIAAAKTARLAVAAPQNASPKRKAGRPRKEAQRLQSARPEERTSRS
jgi:hypothetical protein